MNKEKKKFVSVLVVLIVIVDRLGELRLDPRLATNYS